LQRLPHRKDTKLLTLNPDQTNFGGRNLFIDALRLILGYGSNLQ
jgi:hypothetical protein